ncbi:alpha/beta fold hydrolase [Kineococcus sp. SYSU DK018]|uniref:alpha/beta fold hydrolase n=1 Tax=Kineococcus sp. SYSU DK018 TaxID=3383139 RepID=UPI003D7CE5F0
MQLEQVLEWRGRQVRWTRCGNGPAVVFCHGTPWSSWLWAPFAEALAARFTVHLWDMPGYGASSKEPGHAGAVRAYVAGASHRGLSGAQLDALLEPWTTPQGQVAFYRQIAPADEAFTDVLEPLCGSLELPVHVVWGQEDTWIPVDRAHRLAGAIPGAALTVVPGAGHLVQLDQPVHLATTLHGWLSARG